MSSSHNKGTKLEWNWGSGTATGTVQETFTSDITKTIKGTEVTRNATEDNPAYLIEQDDGDKVLKSHSEVSEV
jgi:hypothetical protein